MKKNYFSTLFAALMLFVAMPASAQVSSVADLFGEYRFTADVEILNNAYSDKFSGDCDATISKASSTFSLKASISTTLPSSICSFTKL